jgi:hypothetical protein
LVERLLGRQEVRGSNPLRSTEKVQVTGLEHGSRQPFPLNLGAAGSQAELDVTVELATEEARQVAVLIKEAPGAILDSISTMTAFLQTEMRFQVDTAIDAHVLAQIAAEVPDAGSSGADLIEQVRNAIAEMRAKGANPTLLVVNGSDAAALDLVSRGGDNMPVFATRATGSSSPLYGVRVVEVAQASEPLLIDPDMLGVLYQGPATFASDPYTGFRRPDQGGPWRDPRQHPRRTSSTCGWRLCACTHVRNIDGAFVVGEESRPGSQPLPNSRGRAGGFRALSL